METSDSEYFESADESFHSDDDSVIANRVKNLDIKDSKTQEKKQYVRNVAVEEKSCQIAKEYVKNVSTENVVKQEGKPTQTKSDMEEYVQKVTEAEKQRQIAKEQVKDINGSAQNVDKQKGRSTKPKLGTKLPKTPEIKKEPALAKPIEPRSTPKEEIKPERDEQVEENLWENDDGWGDIEDNLDSMYPKTVEAELELLKKEAESMASVPVVNQTDLAESLTDTGEVKKGRMFSKYIPDEDRWEFDSWEPLEHSDEEGYLELNKEMRTNGAWPGWGTWDVSALLSTATQGVTTLTSHVSQGISTVLESGMGVPNPEEMARINSEENKQHNEEQKPVEDEEKQQPKPGIPFGLGNLVSGVSQITKIVETTGNKVILGGLDTLETIGKKTMEVLQEGDPGLKKKRAFLKIDQDRPVLSQLLREAKEKADQENRDLQQKHLVKKPNYESMFDDYQGLVHLEALEMLSKQCDIKLQTILETCSGDALKDLQETLEQVKELCEIPDEDEEENTNLEEIKSKLEAAVSEINVPISYEKLILSWEETDEWLTTLNLNVCNEGELHKQAIETLAQLTAMAVEQFHKMGELLLVKEYRSTADEADSLVQ